MFLARKINGKVPDQDIVIHQIRAMNKKPLVVGVDAIEDLALSGKDTYREVREDGSVIEWVLPHSKKFPDFINKHFGSDPRYKSDKQDFIEKIKKAIGKGSDSELFAYQLFIRDYMRVGTPYRGIVLEHGLGSGKSRTAISVAETFREKGYLTLVLTPAFLRLNFYDEIKKWGGRDIRVTDDMTPQEIKSREAIINKFYKFVHYNATGYSKGAVAGKGSVFEQLAKLGIGFPSSDPNYGGKFPYLNDKYGELRPPENMLIIIEEMHGMNRSLVKGPGTLRYYLYPLLMLARNCKVIGLTGTPIVSSAFETSPMYNILRGAIKKDHRALPESEDEFNMAFVDTNTMSMTNREQMASRILGLSSFFKGITHDKERVIYPSGKDSKDHIIFDLVLPDYQSNYAKDIYSSEVIADKKKKYNIEDGEEIVKKKDLSTYFVKSRQACNFAWPMEFTRPRKSSTLKWDNIVETKFKFVPAGDEDDVTSYSYILDMLSKNSSNDLKEYREKFVSQKTVAGVRKVLTDAIVYLYGKTNPVKDRKHILLTGDILTPEDTTLLMLELGRYEQRLNAAIDMLVRQADKYLTIKELREQYSAKMAQIYTSIMTDKANGATYVDYEADPKPVTGTDDDYSTGPIGYTSGIDGEIDIVPTNTPVKTIKDPEDALLQKEFSDVYLPDHKIKGRVRGGPALVYSFFNQSEGVGIFSKVLQVHGFHEFTRKTWDGKTPIAEIERMPRYAFIRGGMNKILKERVLKAFNSKANAHGQIIRVLFVTLAASEGISLFSLRQIHIMEPDWSNGTINQVIGRGFRLLSHRYLDDKDERRVQVYKYTALSSDKSDTADQLVKRVADKRDILLNQLKEIRSYASVDCELNRDYNKLSVPCFKFAGTKSGDAYTLSLKGDITNTDQIVSKKEKVKYEYIFYKDKHHIYYRDSSHAKTVRVNRPGKPHVDFTVYELYEISDPSWKPGNPINMDHAIMVAYVHYSESRKKINVIDPDQPNIKIVD